MAFAQKPAGERTHAEGRTIPHRWGMKPGGARVYLVFFLSGIAGLGYEIAWTRMLTVGLGHEYPSVIAVVAAFFAGFALGAVCLDRVVSRTAHPARWYAVLEAVVGVWAIVTTALIPWVNERANAWIGVDPGPARHWLLAFVIPCLVLLPATFAMGATLPTIESLVNRLRGDGRYVGGLYGANTLGAVAGTLGTTLFLAPWLGFRATVYGLAVVNGLCALLIGSLDSKAIRKAKPLTDIGGVTERHVNAPSSTPASTGGKEIEPLQSASLGTGRLLAILAATGLLGIGYEVIGVRVMGQILEDTVYSFAAALSIYLLGTAVGAALYQLLAANSEPRRLLANLLAATVLTCLLGILMLVDSRRIYLTSRDSFGGGVVGCILAEMLLALAVFGAPTIVMGATFSHVAQWVRAMGGGLGKALAVNTLGAALAPPFFGVMLLPLLGSKGSLLLIAGGYAALIFMVSRRGVAWVMPFVVLAATAIPFKLIFVNFLPTLHLIEAREGVMGVTAVLERGRGESAERVLKINDRFQMGSTGRGAFSEVRQAHVPLLLHPHPKRALFLGLGTGITLAACGVYPDLKADGVELVPEVVDALPYFRPDNAAIFDNLKIHVYTADARRFIRASREQYDVIVADLFHPARDGAALLYTTEHFEAARGRLAPAGLFAQWLPIYQMDPPTFKTIIRTFLAVFPAAQAYYGYFNAEYPMIALVGGEDDLIFDADRLLPLSQATREALNRAAINNPYQIFGCYAASAADLTAFAGEGPINRDDLPIVLFTAPSHVYDQTAPGPANLDSMLRAFRPKAGDLHFTTDDPLFRMNLHDFLTSRDLVFYGLLATLVNNDADARKAWLGAATASPFFGMAYELVLQAAEKQMALDPLGARKLLQALDAARPERDEARKWLDELQDGNR